MRRILLVFIIMFYAMSSALAAKLPQDVVDYINQNVPNADIRFDGVVIFPDNTIYLPLFPSLFSDINTLKIKKTYPDNTALNQKPDIVIFNNDLVLMKVLKDEEGRRTVLHLQQPPLEVRTGLLPQDMLVPSEFILPENIKGIVGNLKIDIKGEDIIKTTTKESFEEFFDYTDIVQNQALIPELKDKMLFVTTNYSKNIQAIEPAKAKPSYALVQKSIPIMISPVNNGKFILVTSYERPFIDVISVADSRFIKQIELSSFPDEIIIDEAGEKAYITSPTASTIFVIDIKTMSLVQKIKINGYCENLVLDKGKLLYTDKMKSEIWTIETDNDYALKKIGRFPNISAIAFADNKIYLASRTKSRIARIDYDSHKLLDEFTTVNKPVAFQRYGDFLFVLGAQNNEIQKINIKTDEIVETIPLNTEGFSKGFRKIDGTNLAVITDVKTNKYTIFDLSKSSILATYSLGMPTHEVVITNKIKLFN